MSPVTKPLAHVCIYILSSLKDSNKGNAVVLVIMNHFLNLTKNKLLGTTIAQDIAEALTKH